MTTRADIYAAIKNADAAGDSDAVRKLGAYLQTMPPDHVPQSLVQTPDGGMVPSGSPAAQAAVSPVSQSDTQNFLAGAGKAFVDLGRGAGQLLGIESRQDVADARARDAPLMATKSGKAGDVVGSVAATVPALAIPGANTVAGAGAIGAGLGLLQPSTSTKETLLNTGVGAVAGAAGQAIGGKLAEGANNLMASRAAAAGADESTNAARDTILKASRDAGYVIPPTAVNDSGAATALESVAGKASLRQVAAQKNAQVTNRLIADDLGIQANTPITREALQDVRKTAGKVYGAVADSGKLTTDPQYAADLQSIAQAGTDVESGYPGIGAQANAKVGDLVKSLQQASPDANQAVAAFKFLNDRAKSNFKMAFNGDPQALELAKAQKGGADAIGDLIERNLQNGDNPDLAQAWRDARVTIAKTYTAEAALKGGNIDAGNLAKQLQKGKPLSGGFKTVADFADQFGDVAKLPQSGAGVSKLAAAIGGGGAVTSLALGHPEIAAVEAGLAAAPWATRKALLSQVGQRAMATPNYAPGALGTTALKSFAVAGRAGQLAGPASNSLIKPTR